MIVPFVQCEALLTCPAVMAATLLKTVIIGVKTVSLFSLTITLVIFDPNFISPFIEIINGFQLEYFLVSVKTSHTFSFGVSIITSVFNSRSVIEFSPSRMAKITANITIIILRQFLG